MRVFGRVFSNVVSSNTEWNEVIGATMDEICERVKREILLVTTKESCRHESNLERLLKRNKLKIWRWVTW